MEHKKSGLFNALIKGATFVTVVALIFCAGGCESKDNDAKEAYKTVETKDVTGVMLMDNVGKEMLNADYWIAKTANPNKLLMSVDEIKQYNEKARKELSSVAGAYYDIQSYTASIDKEALTKALTVSDDILSGDYYIDGAAVSVKYKTDLLRNVNISAAGDVNPVRFGIITSRTNIRILPTNDVITDSPEDMFFDILQNSEALINEPAVILSSSADNLWLFIETYYYRGWIPADDIGICKDKKQWNEAYAFDKFIIVTANRFRIDETPYNSHVSGLELEMGTKLELVDGDALPVSINGRAVYGNYAVKIPQRNTDGSLIYVDAMIPVNRDVSVGYIPYTTANILKQLFKTLGDCYGWGGLLNSRDCSALCRSAYSCCGFEFPRDSGPISSLLGKNQNIKDMSAEEKGKVMDALLPGSILEFPGHIMLYLGSNGGKYYVISSLGSLVPSSSADNTTVSVMSVAVNDLSVKRKSGITWFDALEIAVTPEQCAQ